MDNFKDDHKIAFGKDAKLHPHGDPDSGDGWYGNKLSYKEWYELSCAKRGYLEQAENSTVAITWLVIGGLKYPWPAIGAGLAYLLGSIVLTYSYQRSGANTGAKCLGRLVQRGSLWNMAGI